MAKEEKKKKEGKKEGINGDRKGKEVEKGK